MWSKLPGLEVILGKLISLCVLRSCDLAIDYGFSTVLACFWRNLFIRERFCILLNLPMSSEDLSMAAYVCRSSSSDIFGFKETVLRASWTGDMPVPTISCICLGLKIFVMAFNFLIVGFCVFIEYLFWREEERCPLSNPYQWSSHRSWVWRGVRDEHLQCSHSSLLSP